MAVKQFYTRVNGAPTSTVAAFDEANVPSTAEKAALVGPSGFPPSASDPLVTKSYADTFNEWYKSVEYSIDYVKTDAGAPSGTGVSGELCLNTNEAKRYAYTSSWDAGVAVTSGQRYIFKDSGSDTSGSSGTYTKDDKIYDYNGATFDETVPTTGASVLVDDEGASGVDYRFDSADWVAKPSLLDRDKVPVLFTFRYDGGFAESQTDVEPYDVLGSFQRIQMPSAGSIVKTSVQSSSACTAGTLTVEPTIAGVKVTENGLDLQLNSTTETLKDRAEIAPATANLTFTAGQEIGFMLTSDGTWAHGSGNLRVDIYVVFDT